MSLLLARRYTFWNTKRFPITPIEQQEQAILKARANTLEALEKTASSHIDFNKLTTNIELVTQRFKNKYNGYTRSYEVNLAQHMKQTVLKKSLEKQRNVIGNYFDIISQHQTTISEINALLDDIKFVRQGRVAFDQIDIIDKTLGEAYWEYLENERVRLYNDPANPFPMRAKLSSLFIMIACTAAAIATTTALASPAIICAGFSILTFLISCMIAYLTYNLVCALPHYHLQKPISLSETTERLPTIPTIKLMFTPDDLSNETSEKINKIDVTTNEDNNTISISLG